MTIVKRGDQYLIPIALTNDGEAIALEDVERVRFSFFNAGQMLCKEYPSEVTWDSTNHVFLFPVTEADTLAFRAGQILYDARVKFLNGDIIGLKQIGVATVAEVLDGTPLNGGA